MPGTCDEPNAQPLEVVEGVVEGVDLELATVAGACVDVTNAQRTAEYGTNLDPAGASRMRRLSSAGGGGSETMPIEAIWRSVFIMTVSYRSCPL